MSWFQVLIPPTQNVLTGHFDPFLVAVSYLAAAVSSYVALTLMVRLRHGDAAGRRLRLIYGAGVSLGGGIWAMHFIGMLAFHLPLEVSYRFWPTLASLLLAVGVSGFGFHRIRDGRIRAGRLARAGFWMGLGIFLMHYLGMSGLQFAGRMVWRLEWILLSGLIAVGAATAALWLSLRVGPGESIRAVGYRAAGALVMGLAITGMHYTGMAAATFIRLEEVPLVGRLALQADFMAYGTVLILAIILSLAVITSSTVETLGPRQRLAALILIMSIVAFSVAFITLGALYRTGFEQERQRLLEIARSQAMLMDAGEDKEAHPGSSPVAVKAFQEAYGRFEGIGKTGEIIMGARQGNTIVFWVTQRMQGSELPVTSWDSPLGEPMRQALSGRTGALVGLDYRGQQVLAAHVPVQNGHMGLVAKIDLSEIREPFLQAGMFAGSVAVAGVMLGAWLFFGITNPVIRRLEKEIERREAAQAALTQSREDLSQAQEVAHVGNWVWEIPADTVRWSAETYRIFGFRPGEPANPAGQFEKVVHPEDWPRVDRAINAALDEDKPFEIEHRVVWPDGTERHVFGRGRVERDASGRPVKLVGTVQDITLRKRAQEALQRVTLEKEKIESELEFARLVQEGFLPEKPPSPEGYLFAAKSVPAKFIGGDFYDFIDLGRKRLGVVLGDVSGKGVSAALFMAQLLSDFRYVSLMDPDPSQILSRVNDIQCRRSRRGMFATGVYMFMDLERHVLRVANAGHPRALLRSAAGEIRREGVVGGVPLGILPGSRYPVWDLRLQRGDTMLLFTDGVHEAFNADQELFGLKRLENILAAHEGTPEELIMRVEDAVSRHRRPRDPTDDLTMVAFKFL